MRMRGRILLLIGIGLLGGKALLGQVDMANGPSEIQSVDNSDIPQEPKKTVHIPGPNDFLSIKEGPLPKNLEEVRAAIGYPPLAKEAEIEGKVVLRILVDTTGAYVQHITVNKPPKILLKAVETHIAKLAFIPAVGYDDRPVYCWITVPFPFRLDD